MKAQKTQSLTQQATNPKQVWQTLAAAQQKMVFQTVVRICYSLIQAKEQGEPNEPKPSH
jgi:hypothetical protein